MFDVQLLTKRFEQRPGVSGHAAVLLDKRGVTANRSG